MADPMLNAAKQLGGQFAEQQKEKVHRFLNCQKLVHIFDTTIIRE